MRDLGQGNFQIFSAVPNRPLESYNEMGVLGKKTSPSSDNTWFLDTSVFDKMKISVSKYKGKFLGYESNVVKIKNNYPIDKIDSWKIKKVENSDHMKTTCFFMAHGQNKILDMKEKHHK